MSLREQFGPDGQAFNHEVDQLLTRKAEGVPQFVPPVTIDDPFTCTALAVIVSVLFPVPAIGEVMYMHMLREAENH